MSSQQLVLDVALPDNATFEGFLEANNGQVITALKQVSEGHGEWFTYVHGCKGSGRSHLLQATCRAALEQGKQVAYVPMAEFTSYPPMAVDGLETMDLIALDDVECVAGNGAWEARLFELYNAISDQGGRLLVAAESRAEDLGLGLPDLVSRLNWGLVHRLEVLDDRALEQAFQLRARQRGMRLGDDVARYLLARNARDWDSLGNMLDQLDEASLQHKRRLTLPFVKTVLGE